MTNKIIELDNKEKYVVIDTISYSNKNFVALGKLTKKQNDVDEIVFGQLNDDKVKLVKDAEMIEILKDLFKLTLK